MPGREDFGKLRLSAVDDPRFHSVVTDSRLTLMEVCGVIAILGGCLARDTEDGIIRGDAARYIMRHAPVRYPKALAQAMAKHGLLKEREGGLYLSGWGELYGVMVERRQYDRARKSAGRSAGQSSGGPREGPADVRGQRRVEKRRESPPPPLPDNGGGVGHSDPTQAPTPTTPPARPRPLLPSERLALEQQEEAARLSAARRRSEAESAARRFQARVAMLRDLPQDRRDTWFTEQTHKARDDAGALAHLKALREALAQPQPS